MREKHVEDIWILVNAIRNLQPVPRVLLRKGKRSKSALTHSRERIKSTQTAPQEVDNQSTTDNSYEQVTDIAIGSNMVNEVTNNVRKAINVIGREAIRATIGDSNTHNSVESESFNENNNRIVTNCRVATYECDQNGEPTASHLTVNGTANSSTRSEEGRASNPYSAPPTEQAFKAAVLRDINELMNTVHDIYSKVRSLQSASTYKSAAISPFI